MERQSSTPVRQRMEKAHVHCMICARTVEADVIATGRQLRVRQGQKCPRCSSSLDAGTVVRYDRAA